MNQKRVKKYIESTLSRLPTQNQLIILLTITDLYTWVRSSIVRVLTQCNDPQQRSRWHRPSCLLLGVGVDFSHDSYFQKSNVLLRGQFEFLASFITLRNEQPATQGDLKRLKPARSQRRRKNCFMLSVRGKFGENERSVRVTQWFVPFTRLSVLGLVVGLSTCQLHACL